jgi:hypothetical protein
MNWQNFPSPVVKKVLFSAPCVSWPGIGREFACCCGPCWTPCVSWPAIGRELLYLIFYFSKFMFKSWLVAHENWVSVGSFLVPGNCKNAGFCTIYPRAVTILRFWIFHPSVFKKPFNLCSPCRIRDYPEQNIN